MKVALVHDWLTGLRGGERCLQALLGIFPEADIFTLVHIPGSTSKEIDARVKGCSFLNSNFLSRRLYRMCLPLFPAAAGKLRIAGYDLVISLSHAAAKNAAIDRNSTHLCYCFTPMRYIWDQARIYLGSMLLPLWPLIRSLRSWDVRGSRSVTEFIAISSFVAARIRCFYRRPARLIYPPVDPFWFEQELKVKGEARGAYLYAGALVPYKNIEHLVNCFNKSGKKLWVVGRGPLEAKLRRMAKANIEFFGHVSDSELRNFYRRARALIFPAKEDFGLVPIECMAAGTPVIALYEGGAKETVNALKSWKENESKVLDSGRLTGVFIRRGKTKLSTRIEEGVEVFEKHEDKFSPPACREQARIFSLENFRTAWFGLLAENGIELVDNRQELRVSLGHGASY